MNKNTNFPSNLSLIEEIFDVFSSRCRPEKVWETSVADGRHIAKNVPQVNVQDFNFEHIDRHIELDPYGIYIHSFTPQGFQYYLPALMSMCIEDFDRADGLPDVLCHALHRIPPFVVPIEHWVSKIEIMEPEDALKDLYWAHSTNLKISKLEKWFLKRSHPEQIAFTVDLTTEEKRIVLKFIDFLESSEEFRDFEICAVRSFYDNGPLCKRLGATKSTEIEILVHILQSLLEKYPSRFEADAVNDSISQLKRESSLY